MATTRLTSPVGFSTLLFSRRAGLGNYFSSLKAGSSVDIPACQSFGRLRLAVELAPCATRSDTRLLDVLGSMVGFDHGLIPSRAQLSREGSVAGQTAVVQSIVDFDNTRFHRGFRYPERAPLQGIQPSHNDSIQQFNL